MRPTRRLWWLLCLLGLPSSAQTLFRPTTDAALQVVPDRFLREFDPITVFFKKARGPENGGPVDQPGKLFQLSPNHPGTLEWLDANTLQFVPTIAWPALDRFRVSVSGKNFNLMTLVRAPVKIDPAPGTSDLVPRGNIALTFPQVIDPETLAKMIRLEVKPLPGLDDQRGYWLSNNDFSLKSLERHRLEDPATYVLTLNSPLPDGHDISLQIQVAPDRNLTEAVLEYRFQTRTPFRLTHVGIGQVTYPIAAQGSIYQREQVLTGRSTNLPLFLQFSHEFKDPGIETIKKLVGFEPAVRNLTYDFRDNRLFLRFDCDTDQGYRLTLRPTSFRDAQDRPLDMPGESRLWFFYPSQPHSLALDHVQGLVERFGPQQIPMKGLGDAQVDVRIYKVDPLDLRYWPFLPSAIGPIDESQPPPGPGEETTETANKAAHLRQLGSPLISRVMDVPLDQATGMNRFGLDLGPAFDDISGPDRAATYLVGIRRLDKLAGREYTRVQVTDLNLTSWENRGGVTFAVTSLRTGEPVAGAEIKLEGRQNSKSEPMLLMQGTTDGDGLFHYRHRNALSANLFRFTVRTSDDMLVLDPNHAPPFFFDNHWYRSSGPWLGWLRNTPNPTPDQDNIRAHLFSERPVYRPDEDVHLRGIIRRMNHGRPEPILDRKWQIEIYGPGGKTWSYPVALDQWGSFYKKWQEKDLPTGDYTVQVVDRQRRNLRIGSLKFKKEPYRIPRFEVNLTGPDLVRLDQPFEVELFADYYAGGRVVGQEVNWQISQEALTYSAPNWPGFLFSSDSRFSSGNAATSSPVETKHDITDENGSAKLVIDPTQHPEWGPTRFIVEAEVSGLDQQSVATYKTIRALPPFVLGLKMDRLVKDRNVIQPQFVVLGPDGEPVAGQEFRLRLLRRQWHAYLRESDFTTGDVKYETDIVDETLLQETHRSGTEPLTATFTLQEAGVYIVEMAARDHLGRLQKVHVDFFMVGDTPVSWEKSKDLVFEMAWDKFSYNPGETANLILKSPFQEARALVAVESPEGLRYQWVAIENGQGLFQISVTAAMSLQIPVHALLMRGRIEAEGPRAKPIAMASSQTLRVKPRGFQAKLSLSYEDRQLPGANMPVELTLEDPDGNPLDGMVTLWLVDRAVLALGQEANLNPVNTFIRAHESHMRLRDTRNLVFGEIPLEEMPGGDGYNEMGIGSAFGQVTVRRNFKTVPYYEPQIQVTGGKARITVPLPDNLTEFAIRAVAVADENRFGMAGGRVAIRLPVIVQSALPRFVRPGDKFEAGGIARVVDGPGGAAEAAVVVEGLSVQGDTERDFTLEKDQPHQLYFPITVEAQAAPLDQAPNSVKLSLAVRRTEDGASDAFEVSLPVRPDRRRTYRESLHAATIGEPIPWPAPEETPRPGTLSRQLRVSGHRDLIALMTGLGFNARYPHGCTEQRVSQLYPELALRPLLERLDLPQRLSEGEGPLRELLAYLGDVQEDSGLFAFWPGSRGSVNLTAYVTQFLLTIPDETDQIDAMLDRALNALQGAVRSDSPQLMRGYGLEERAAAMLALVQAGRGEEAYLNDLAALGRNLSLDGEASVLTALLKANREPGGAANRMAEDLRRSLNVSRTGNTAMVRDLQYRAESWGGPLLSSEAKTMAGVTQALYHYDPAAEEVGLLKAALVRLGSDDGWGDTRANAAALLTLGDLLQAQTDHAAGVHFQLKLGAREVDLDTGDRAVRQFQTDDPGEGQVVLVQADDNTEPLAWFQTTYVPDKSGDLVAPEQKGFAVSRDWKIYDGTGAGQPISQSFSKPGQTTGLNLGSVVEDHVRVVNPEDRTYVAVSIPFAAGLDPLNPQLATAPSYAKPAGTLTRQPSYIKFSDDRIHYYYDNLPKGTYDFYVRLKATISGSFTQPAAIAEMMYRLSVYGSSAGSKIEVHSKTE